VSQNIFLDPSVSSLPAFAPGAVGNGTLTVDKLSHFTVTQDYTAICTATDPFTVFNIIGSLDGPVGVAIVGTQFVDQDKKIFLTVNQGPILFEVGDTFEFSVIQGTDLTQSNLDTYNELPQKNFGLGVIGENKGDHNVRFNEAAQLAFREIQDLKFTSKLAGSLGNLISIEYFLGTVLASASKVIQDLTYTASIPGASGNDIQIAYEQFTPAVQAERQVQDILFTAKPIGVLGNAISVEYIAGGTAGSEGVNVIGSKVQVQIDDGVSTADQVRVAIGGNPTAFALLDGISTGTGLEPQTTQAEIFLLGGLDAIGDAGNEVVTVLVNLITVKLESGVSTAQNVYDAILGSAPALALVTPSISGTPATTQIAPVIATNLENGADNVGIPGSEVVNVVDNQIQVTFVSGLSSAQQIKTAIEGNVSADALVTVTLIGLGQQETTDLQALATADITNGESLDVSDANDVRTVRFYYRIDTVDVPPGSGDDIPIDIATGDTSGVVAIKTAATINSEPEWNVATPATSVFRVINADVGPSTDISNVDVGVGQAVPFNIVKVLDGFSIGEELETSPVSRTFLGGGLGQGTYAFNTKELTVPGSFNEGNAGILVTGMNNQGDETTSGVSLKKGVVTLDDNVPANLSGPIVDNTQKTINNLIQNGKVVFVSENEGKVLWSKPAGTLDIEEDLKIFFTETGIVNTILASNFPIAIADGEHIWVVVDRQNSVNLTINQGTTVPDSPNGENVFRLLTRVGTSLIWWDNTFQREGKKLRIGEGAGTGAFQEKLGVGNGVQTSFPILSGLFPVNKDSILVFANAHQFVDTEWDWNEITNDIEFVVAPEVGVEPYIYYLTDGDSISPPSVSGIEQSYVHTVSVLEQINKELQLIATPAQPSKMLVDIIGGTSQIINIDFQITGDLFQWTGLALDGVLTSGDKVRFHFFS